MRTPCSWGVREDLYKRINIRIIAVRWLVEGTWRVDWLPAKSTNLDPVEVSRPPDSSVRIAYHARDATSFPDQPRIPILVSLDLVCTSSTRRAYHVRTALASNTPISFILGCQRISNSSSEALILASPTPRSTSFGYHNPLAGCYLVGEPGTNKSASRNPSIYCGLICANLPIPAWGSCSDPR